MAVCGIYRGIHDDTHMRRHLGHRVFLLCLYAAVGQNVSDLPGCFFVEAQGGAHACFYALVVNARHEVDDCVTAHIQIPVHLKSHGCRRVSFLCSGGAFFVLGHGSGSSLVSIACSSAGCLRTEL